MKTIIILSALLLGAGLSFAGPDGAKDGKCKKGDCKKDAAAATAAPAGTVHVVLDDDDKPAARPERKPRGEAGAKPERGPRGEGAEGRRGRGGPGAMAERLKAKDTNNDGLVSLAEFKVDLPEDRAERALKFFGMVDKNDDGSISLADELKPPTRGERGGKPGAERGGKPGGDRGARGGKPGGERGGDAPARPKRPALD